MILSWYKYIIISINNNNQNNNKTNNSANKSPNKYVSKSFINKIRNKEMTNNIFKEINYYNHYNNNIDDLSQLFYSLLIQLKTTLLVNNHGLTFEEIKTNIIVALKLS